MSASPFIHVTSGDSAAGSVRETLRKLGRHEEVVALRDSLDAGPLHDVDSGAAARIAWWDRIYVKPRLRASERRAIDEGPKWRDLVTSGKGIVVWHGPHIAERLVLLRACWYLRHTADRVSEVRFAPPESKRLPAFYGAVGCTPIQVGAQRWEQRARVAHVAELAAEWERLRSAGEGFRFLEDDRVVLRPVNSLDAAILGACTGEWRSPWRAIAKVIADTATSDLVLAWRLRELIAAGAIEGRGEGTHAGLPAEIRVS